MALSHRPRLQQRLVLIFSLVLLIPLSITSTYTMLRIREIMLARVQAEQLQLAEARTNAAERALSEASADLLALFQGSALRSFGRDDRDPDLAQLREIARLFESFLARSAEDYHGLRLLDAAGYERLAVNADGSSRLTSGGGGVSLLDQPYFANALSLAGIPGRQRVYISAVDLLPRQGTGLAPTPVLRYATLLQTDRGRVAGVIVLEAAVGPIFEQLVTAEPGVITYIVDSDGLFLYHPATHMRFAGQPSGAPRLADDQPRDAQQILRQPAGVIVDSPERPGLIQVFTRVRPLAQSGVQWTVIYAQPIGGILGEVYITLLVTLLLTMAALLVTLGVIMVLTRWIVRPLADLAADAERVGQGDLEAPIRVQGADEIGVVAETFAHTVARLRASLESQAAVAVENAQLLGVAQQELTERRRGEQVRARLTAILEATSDLVAMIDLEGRVMFLNQAGRRGLGIGDEAELQTTTIGAHLPAGAARQMFQEAMPAALRAGLWSGETTMLSVRGEIPVSQVIVAHHAPDGSPEYFSMIIRDISERKQAEEELRQAQKMEALGRLAGGLAHDFNNILTVIAGECDLILMDEGLDPEVRAGVEQIHRADERAGALTRQLLAFSRRQVLQAEVINLNEIVAAMEQMLHRLIGEDIALVTACDPELGAVRADPGQIEQVIMNLAVNARDAMPNGGHLQIATRQQLVRPGTLTAKGEPPPGEYVVLSVSDSGCGIEREAREHIFEPFFTTKPRGKGTGLGLATVLGIVAQSGGSILFDSTPGEGSIFRIYLPVVASGQQEQPPSAPATPRAARGETILLVEDDPSVRNLTRQVLERHGFQVLVASDGVQAQAVFAAHHELIQLVLTDIVMPGGLTGVQLAQILLGLRPQLRVLYMSGYTDNALVVQSIERDGAGYIQKPFTATNLVRAIDSALDRKPLAQRADP